MIGRIPGQQLHLDLAECREAAGDAHGQLGVDLPAARFPQPPPDEAGQFEAFVSLHL